MKQTKEYIQELLDRFDCGHTTEAEELWLADYFHNADTVPDEWLAHKELFESFKTDAYDFSQEELDAMLVPVDGMKAKVVRLWPWLVAACVAGALVLFLMPPKTTDKPVDERPAIAKAEPVPTIKAEQKEDIPETESTSEVSESKRQSKVKPKTAVAQQPAEEEPADEPVQMSDETKMELLMAYLTGSDQLQEEKVIDPEEEIRQIRQRGELLLGMCNPSDNSN